MGKYSQYLNDIRTAAKYAEQGGMSGYLYANILRWLGDAEGFFGNFISGINAAKRSLEVEKTPAAYHVFAKLLINIADYEAGKETAEEGIKECNTLISKGAKGWVLYWKHALTALLLSVQGKYAEAEPYLRSIQKISYSFRYQSPSSFLRNNCRMVENLIQQGRLIEAEMEARDALNKAIAICGNRSGTALNLAKFFITIKLNRGQIKDADKLIRIGNKIFEESDLSQNPRMIAEAYSFFGDILTSSLDFSSAIDHYNTAKESLHDNEYYYNKYFSRNRNYMLSLLKTQHVEEAMRLISSAYDLEKKYFGLNKYDTAELLGLRGMANALLNLDDQAMEDFTKSIPILLKDIDKNIDYPKQIRFKIIVEAYLTILSSVYKDKSEKKYNINVPEEIFKTCEALNKSVVQIAIGASGARAAATDSELADLVRREQDSFNQIKELQQALSTALDALADQRYSSNLKNLKDTIDVLNDARSILLDEIKRRFPKYSVFMNPQPVEFSLAKKYLRSNEALVVICPFINHTYVWAISQMGQDRFSIVPIGEKYLKKSVANLRRALDLKIKTFGNIPKFDLATAHDFYSKLLKPIEDGWKDANDLHIVALGPLGQLPFSILPAANVNLEPDGDVLFENYRKVPWLIRKVSVTRLPSVFSFVTLRKIPEGDSIRKAFVGFGDPLYNREQLAQAEGEKNDSNERLASRGGRVSIRGIRITGKGDLDSEQITSANLDYLSRLPDTAEEIRSIGSIMGADPIEDIYLGIRASERNVKNINLSNRRVIAFASHALLPGDLDGLDQPALALSSPTVTGDNEDGLLTMEEVFKLNLNADWVVLSACNTGAADGAGAEAVSGLGRAFFYAGTRAILVSMWPVETTSAKKLTTRLFQYQKEDKTLSRARALQKSMLELIDGPGLKDDATGRLIASYAHPLFWAPFIVVGDGR